MKPVKPVIVSKACSADEANKKYGERYGIDWVYPEQPQGQVGAKTTVTLTWWVGWVILFPCRLFVMFVVGLILAVDPSMFYYFWNQDNYIEHDQSKWR